MSNAAPPPILRPHRGAMVLAFGILGIFPCMPLGIVAWVMANSDLAAMARGEMERSGEGQTRAGKVCGIVGVSMVALALIVHVLVFAVMSVWVVSRHKGG